MKISTIQLSTIQKCGYQKLMDDFRKDRKNQSVLTFEPTECTETDANINCRLLNTFPHMFVKYRFSVVTSKN